MIFAVSNKNASLKAHAKISILNGPNFTASTISKKNAWTDQQIVNVEFIRIGTRWLSKSINAKSKIERK